MSSESFPLTGRCMCGAVEVATTGPLLGVVVCHCKRCQRRSETTRPMTALCLAGAFSVTAGADKLRLCASGTQESAGSRRSASSAAATRTRSAPRTPTLVAIRLGCLDQDPGIRAQAHQFVAYASPLEPIPDDGLPRLPERLGVTEPL